MQKAGCDMSRDPWDPGVLRNGEHLHSSCGAADNLPSPHCTWHCAACCTERNKSPAWIPAHCNEVN